MLLIMNYAAAPQAIVFIVGGGNYIEYQNLMDYSKVCILLEILHGNKILEEILDLLRFTYVVEAFWCKEITVWS